MKLKLQQLEIILSNYLNLNGVNFEDKKDRNSSEYEINTFYVFYHCKVTHMTLALL